MTTGSCQSDTRQTFAEAWRKSRAERYWPCPALFGMSKSIRRQSWSQRS